jgi:predicted metalloprotease with PDZ domain
MIFCCNLTLNAQTRPVNMAYRVSMESPANHLYHVSLRYSHPHKTSLEFTMCAWTPGFYQIVDFAGSVQNFQVKDKDGKELKWIKSGANTWRVSDPKKEVVNVSYDVKAENPFIGNINLDQNYGYIIPGAMFLYLKEELQKPVTIQIQPYKEWPEYVATSLDSLPGKHHTFYAANFDVLYDSPLLMGKLETLPSFTLRNKPVQFTGFSLGDFNRGEFTNDLKKIVKSGSAIIGDVPYSHYSFLAVGMKGGGFGGIEHLNSVSMIINTNGLLLPARKNSFYAFLAHEYFHLYNVKRIRPIALGPFDYTKENYTNLLWVSEGFTDYYEYLILRRAGLMSSTEVLQNYQEHISNYENKPGHLFQTANESSRDIWAMEGNPAARTADQLIKTISVYDKGCAIALILDLAIRHQTKNRASLDDVMRLLYKEYYQHLKRGFTDQEFRQACERVAGASLKEVFSYASTVKPVNYPKYFAYAGLNIDTAMKTYPGPYSGADVRSRDSILVVREVAFGSPAWKCGLSRGDQILSVEGVKTDQSGFDNMISKKNIGELVHLKVSSQNKTKEIDMIIGVKTLKPYDISLRKNPDALQLKIYTSWLRSVN